MEFTKEESEEFIIMVRDNPALYNPLDMSYKDVNFKDSIWVSIGQRFKKTDLACKHHWKLLREMYKRYSKRYKETGKTCKTKANLYKKMKFLDSIKEVPLGRTPRCFNGCSHLNPSKHCEKDKIIAGPNAFLHIPTIKHKLRFPFIEQDLIIEPNYLRPTTEHKETSAKNTEPSEKMKATEERPITIPIEYVRNNAVTEAELPIKTTAVDDGQTIDTPIKHVNINKNILLNMTPILLDAIPIVKFEKDNAQDVIGKKTEKGPKEAAIIAKRGHLHVLQSASNNNFPAQDIKDGNILSNPINILNEKDNCPDNEPVTDNFVPNLKDMLNMLPPHLQVQARYEMVGVLFHYEKQNFQRANSLNCCITQMQSIPENVYNSMTIPGNEAIIKTEENDEEIIIPN